MSTAKVIFTYKRKRLSSCSGDGLACPNFSSDVRIGKHQNTAEERSEKPKEDLKIFNRINHDDANLSVNCDSCIEPCKHVESRHKHACQGESFSSACSSPQVHRSSIPKESSHVEESDTVSIKEPMLSPNELAGDNTKALNVSAGASVVKFHNSGQRDSCLDLNSSCPHEEDTEPKQSLPVYSGTGKAKLSTPLLTFSRRLKRKADTGNEDPKIKLPTREGTTSVKDNKPTCVSSCSCEVTSNKSSLVEGCVNLTVVSDDTSTRDVFCQNKEETFSKEIGIFPCSCTRSHDDSVILRHTKGGKCSVKDLNVVDSSANGKQILPDTANLSKENVECSSSIGIGVSYGGDTFKTNKEPVSNKLQRASSGDSQLTSTDDSDSKTVARKTAKQKASSSSLDFSGPPHGGFVIDCNVIPESNLEEQASAIIHDSFGMEKNCGNLVQGHLKTKSLELFRDNGVEADDSHFGNGKSSNDAYTPLKADSKRNNKLLQLFSTDDGKSCRFPPADIRCKINCSKAEENSAFSFDSRKNWHEQSSRRASAFHGLFTQTEPIVGQPSSWHGSSVHPFQQPGFFTQNPMFPPFPDHSSYTFRHKLLLDTINSKASALRVNMNLSLDKFEPCPIVWLDEELDSLWKGVRRHGRGNWHAMLLDPRLHFSPWRTARDLADQWEREQCILLSGQQMPQGKYPNLPQPCNSDCNGGFSCPRTTGIMRGSVVAETQLSLGDVYAQKGSTQSYGIIPAHNKHLRMASCGLAMNNNNNNWLREPFGSLPKSTEAAMPSISGLSQMGGPQIVNPFAEPSGTSRRPKNPSMRKRAVKNNVIVIDSDVSSEETVSDDHNVRS